MKKKLKKKHTVKKRKSILRKSSFWWSVFFVSLFGAVFYFFFLYPYFYVENVYIEGFEIENIEELASPYIEKDFVFFSSKSIFFASLSGIKKEVLNNFHEVESVRVRRVFPSSVKLEAIKREALASWCSGEECFKVDRKGVVFKKGKGGDFVFYKNEEKRAGEKIVTREEMMFMEEIKERVDGTDFFIVNPSALEVHMEKGYVIYFRIEDEIDRQIDNLLSVLREEIKDIESIEYIDLRYGDSVYYK